MWFVKQTLGSAAGPPPADQRPAIERGACRNSGNNAKLDAAAEDRENPRCPYGDDPLQQREFTQAPVKTLERMAGMA